MELADSVLRDGGVERKRMDLSALVQRACVALNHEVKVAHRTLHWSCIPGITVHGVPLDLRRALANLIRNGAKYSPEDGAVQVRLERQGTQAILTVRDEGPGLPPGDPRHLFGRGEHGQDSKSGTGLGLAIVAEAVQNHGGHISAANHPDGGAVFTIQLPVMCSDTEPTVSVS
jgi:signal transduction histidine kinase